MSPQPAPEVVSGRLDDPRAQAVLDRLHAQERRQLRGVVLRHALPLLWARLRGAAMELDTRFLSDKLVALDADKALLCHRLIRALGARCIVEVGSSFGVSTIVLADALRANLRNGGEGRVIATEIEPAKAAAARANWAEAGVDGFIELREGDALHTLKDCGGAVGFVLVDTWMPLARPALDLLIPQLAPGAIVDCDNVSQFAREYADYLARVRDPAGGFESLTLPYRGGLELSVRQR
jgi:predicted O-methyltransferase YrrM